MKIWNIEICEKNHVDFETNDALDFAKIIYERNGLKIEKLSFKKSKKPSGVSYIYMVVREPNANNFIVVVAFELVQGVIFFSEVSSSYNSKVDMCPKDFLEMMPTPEKFSKEYFWFERVRKNNVKYKPRVIINR